MNSKQGFIASEIDRIRLRLSYMVAKKKGSRSVRKTAEEAGISPATLQRVVVGNACDLVTLRLLCIWMNADANEILGIDKKGAANGKGNE